MKESEFAELVEKRLKKCKDVLCVKGKEYSKEEDRLRNFKLASRIGDRANTPEYALLGMWKKHIVSAV